MVNNLRLFVALFLARVIRFYGTRDNRARGVALGEILGLRDDCPRNVARCQRNRPAEKARESDKYTQLFHTLNHFYSKIRCKGTKIPRYVQK